MKKIMTLFGLVFALNGLCLSPLSAFVILKKTDMKEIAPPQYFTTKINFIEQYLAKKSSKTYESIDKNKKAKWLMFASILTLVLFLGFSLLMIFVFRRNWVVISLWALSLYASFTLFLEAKSFLNNTDLTRQQRKKAKAGKIIAFITLCLGVTLMVAALIFVVYFIFLLLSLL